MQRKVEFAPEEYYHLYNRGVDKRPIFLNHDDRLRFLILLLTANREKPFHLSDLSHWQGASLTEIAEKNLGNSLINIGAYCLMPNHFHLLIREKNNNTPVFIKKLLTGYSMYFNIKYHRTGRLFETHFKSQHISEDVHLKYLFAYIHLNPVKIHDPINWEKKIIPNPDQAKKFLNDYRFSSYQHYIGANRPEDVILNRAAFPDYFQKPGEFAEWIDDWANYNE